MMKLLMIFSYFTDGFAYAGEAMTGKYIGAKNEPMLRQTIKWTFVWSMGIALIFIGIYHFAGVPLLRMMTSDMAVVQASGEYLPWLLLMPVIGCAAFTWDGVYIGATASKAIRNSMLWAVVGFAGVWLVGILLLGRIVPSSSPRYGYMAMHILMGAYFAHLLARTLYLSVKYRKTVHL
jgi:MATE family multidrug resistance protein